MVHYGSARAFAVNPAPRDAWAHRRTTDSKSKRWIFKLCRIGGYFWMFWRAIGGRMARRECPPSNIGAAGLPGHI